MKWDKVEWTNGERQEESEKENEQIGTRTVVAIEPGRVHSLFETK